MTPMMQTMLERPAGAGAVVQDTATIVDDTPSAIAAADQLFLALGQGTTEPLRLPTLPTPEPMQPKSITPAIAWAGLVLAPVPMRRKRTDIGKRSS
jgi:hypothetical protein